MDTLTWVVVAVAAVVLIVGLALIVLGRSRANRRTAALQGHFGPEYDRVVAECGGRKRGEDELSARLRRRRELTIRSLAPQERERFASAWEQAQTMFVDAPETGLRDADLLVMQVMRDRGYPVERVGLRAQMISVDFPDLVQHFRDAHQVTMTNEQERVDTETLRRAMVGYRYLLDELLQGGDARPIPRV